MVTRRRDRRQGRVSDRNNREGINHEDTKTPSDKRTPPSRALLVSLSLGGDSVVNIRDNELSDERDMARGGNKHGEVKERIARKASDLTVASENPLCCCVGEQLSFFGNQPIAPSEADRLMRSVASNDH